jgi:hypothetical protein
MAGCGSIKDPPAFVDMRLEDDAVVVPTSIIDQEPSEVARSI